MKFPPVRVFRAVDTFFEGNEDNAVKELNNNWITARRAMMRNPLDRIGFGGYLELAAKFPKFIQRAAEICDEFRYIYDTVKTQTPSSFAKVAVLNAWGKKRSWMCNMTAHELWYQQSYSYQGIYEALSGMPVDVSFINFDDVKAGRLAEFDVVINAGDAGTAWSGGENWLDEEVITAVRKFVYNGGGFIGVGEPTTQFKKDLKTIQKRGLKIELLTEVLNLLANGEKLPEKYKDHSLSGNYAHCRECHIQPDWLLIYEYAQNELILYLTRTGSHSDLF